MCSECRDEEPFWKMKAILASQADQVSVVLHKDFHCSYTSSAHVRNLGTLGTECEESPVATV